jgi:hypothetical protein
MSTGNGQAQAQVVIPLGRDGVAVVLNPKMPYGFITVYGGDSGLETFAVPKAGDLADLIDQVYENHHDALVVFSKTPHGDPIGDRFGNENEAVSETDA